ncbi:MAG: SRPBCC family protein [Solirubrobacteraceae bacterium]
MPTARRSRTIAATEEALWEVIRDPHHLPRWWPRVSRVEDVEADAFTEVMLTAKGKVVRADFKLLCADDRARLLRWAQTVEGTPFARLLKSAETEVRLAPAPGGSPAYGGERATEVTIELSQSLSGFFPRLGGYMVRRAAATTLDEALDGLERISG